MVLVRTFFIVAVGLFSSRFAGASDHDDVNARPYDITSFYVFSPTRYVDPTPLPEKTNPEDVIVKIPELITDKSLVFVLNVNSHQGYINNFQIFAKDAKYSIYVSSDGDLVADFVINVFFGGSEQYAFYVNKDSEPILGKIGEFAERQGVKVYAGRRADPEVFDRQGFDDLFTNLCAPVTGLRCTGGVPANAYGGLNVGAIVIELPTSAIIADDKPERLLKIWAKSFKSE